MCGSNPELSPEVNSAKCIGGTALGFAIVTIVGFLLDWPGAISAVAGILSVIGNSIVCCCGPKAKGEGAGKFTAAMVLNIIACILHFAAIIGVVVFYLGMLAHVNAETAKCVECACRTEYQNSQSTTTTTYPDMAYADGCSPEYCMSDDGYGGTDCYAPAERGEECTCSQGQARVYDESTWDGTPLYHYTCCTNSELDNPPVVGESCGVTGRRMEEKEIEQTLKIAALVGIKADAKPRSRSTSS